MVLGSFKLKKNKINANFADTDGNCVIRTEKGRLNNYDYLPFL